MEATIIDLQGDSIKGLIDYRNWEKNPHTIQFKNSIDGKSKLFNASQIKGFEVADEKYVGAIVQTEVSTYKTNELITYPPLMFEVDTVFLQTMIEGNRSLYYLKNNRGNDQFYINNETGFDLLKYKRFLVQNGGKEFIDENKSYLNQLQVYLQDCLSIQQELEKTKYNKKGMQNLFEYYFKCMKSKVDFTKKNEKLSSDFGILAGISSTSLQFTGFSNEYLTQGNFNPSTNFAGGAYFDVVLLRNLKRWSLCNEIFFNSYSTNGHFAHIVNDNYYTITDTKFAYSYLRYNLLIRYRHWFKKGSMFFNTGMSNGLAIKEVNYSKNVSKFYTSENITEGKAIPDTRKHEQGFLYGIGAAFKRYSIECRYEAANAMSPTPSLGSSADRIYLLLGFRFKKG